MHTTECHPNPNLVAANSTQTWQAVHVLVNFFGKLLITKCMQHLECCFEWTAWKSSGWERNSMLIREECTKIALLSGSEFSPACASMNHACIRKNLSKCLMSLAVWMSRITKLIWIGWHHDAWSFTVLSSSCAPSRFHTMCFCVTTSAKLMYLNGK